jgi:uncharacterized protein YneF (UPF0154 family)
METLITKAQKLVVLALAVLLIIVVVLSTIHLGFLVAEEIQIVRLRAHPTFRISSEMS